MDLSLKVDQNQGLLKKRTRKFYERGNAQKRVQNVMILRKFRLEKTFSITVSAFMRIHVSSKLNPLFGKRNYNDYFPDSFTVGVFNIKRGQRWVS